MLGIDDGLVGDGQRDQVEEGRADQARGVLADRVLGRAYHDDRAVPDPVGRVYRRARLADDETRRLAADVSLNFCLHWINDLELEAAVQSIKVTGPPVDDEAV